MHSSRGFLVSGQAQQGFNFFFSPSTSVGASVLTTSSDCDIILTSLFQNNSRVTPLKHSRRSSYF